MTEQALTIRDDMSLSDLGGVLVKSGFFADTREASQAVVKVLAGRELGFGPIASMVGVNIIKSRVSLSANLMAAALKRFANGKYNYRIVEHTDKVCELAFFENGQEVGRSRFTAEDARRAGTQNMEKFPKNMLFARAMSNGVKWFAPDVFGGPVYTPEEMGANVNEDGEVIDGAKPAQAAAPAHAPAKPNGASHTPPVPEPPLAEEEPEPELAHVDALRTDPPARKKPSSEQLLARIDELKKEALALGLIGPAWALDPAATDEELVKVGMGLSRKIKAEKAKRETAHVQPA